MDEREVNKLLAENKQLWMELARARQQLEHILATLRQLYEHTRAEQERDLQ